MTSLFKRYLPVLFMAAVSICADGVCARELISINDGWRFSSGNDTASFRVNLPHTWNSDAYSTRDYFRGKGRYSKTLHIPGDFRNMRLYLKFDGAASRSEVSIDGRRAGGHVGAYSPHVIDITPYVEAGGSYPLLVTVDNSDRSVPPYSADFTFMGGLYRDAWLVALPETHLDILTGPEEGFKVVASPGEKGGWRLAVSGNVIQETSRKGRGMIIVRLLDKDGAIVAEKRQKYNIRPGGSSPFEVTFDNLRDVALWTPENPELYSVEVGISEEGRRIDSSRCHTAFRTFGFDDGGRFLLNGRPYKLRGMCRHQDQKPLGIALTDEQHRRDMRLIKDMGANFIRISHYPQDDAVLEMCDRLGLIAWEEIPVIDFVPDDEEFARNAERMLREMIRSHFNHPSIAMWGYMNEILLRMPRGKRQETESRTLALARRLEDAAREEDPSRITTMAFHGSDIYHEAGLGEVTDVKGWNLYQGWYGGELPEFEGFLSRQHREHPSHPLIVSEYGAGSDLRLHSLDPKPFDFSMEYQQKYLEHYLPVIEDSAFVAGASHWNFIDFSSANRAESMPHINNKGILTADRREKDVYYFYKASWTALESDTVAHIASRDWAERTEILDGAGRVDRRIKVYTNLPSVALRVNGVQYDYKDVVNHTAVFDAILADGKNLIELIADDNPGGVCDVMTINVKGIRSVGPMIDPESADLAVNVGSDCYFRSDQSGLTWLPDREYSAGARYGHVGGKRSVSQDEIALTDDQPLLQNSLAGLQEYRIDVVPGRYEVELLFAELSAPSSLSAYMLGHNAGTNGNGITEMDITINGKRVETGFAPAMDSGVKTMVKRRYFTEADGDSGIVIGFAPAEGRVTSLAALKVRKL